MLSKYGIFCKVMEAGGFTRAAAEIGYSQSSVSQTVRTLERELGVTLIARRRDGLALTPDGEQFMPYIQAIASAERALEQKREEMEDLADATVSLGTFTSASRSMLPMWMEGFKALYPGVKFVLRQGEYTSIARLIRNDELDLGFVSTEVIQDLETLALHRDEMMAVLPGGHPLAEMDAIPLSLLAREPFILLDEGDRSLILEAFARQGLTPRVEYTVMDDSTILAMVRKGMGVTVIYDLVLMSPHRDLVVRPVAEHPERNIALAWRSWDTLPLAARRFADYIIKSI